MESQKQTPVNISKSSMSGKCDEKCAYSFKYNISPSCKANNYSSYISLTYDSGTTPPAVFNNFSYNVNNIEIYSPSVHYFNGQHVDAEIIINHTSNSTGAPLLICIPISVSGISTAGSQIITDIINSVSSYPLKPKDPAITININNYNLEDIIPKDPYFYYIGKTQNANIVVFNITSAISISQSSIDKLKSIINGSNHTVAPSLDNSVFYNQNGPSTAGSASLDDGIYIDCKPTGDSEEKTDVTFKKPTYFDLNLSNYISSDVLILLVGAVGFMVLIILINKLIVYLS